MWGWYNMENLRILGDFGGLLVDVGYGVLLMFVTFWGSWHTWDFGVIVSGCTCSSFGLISGCILLCICGFGFWVTTSWVLLLDTGAFRFGVVFLDNLSFEVYYGVGIIWEICVFWWFCGDLGFGHLLILSCSMACMFGCRAYRYTFEGVFLGATWNSGFTVWCLFGCICGFGCALISVILCV